MKSNRFWIAVISGLLIAAVISAYIIEHFNTGGSIAHIYLNGEFVESINLSRVAERYDITVSDKDGYNIVTAENGRICISDADCPDGYCILQGWISGGIKPITCLPHRLVISIAGGQENNMGLDAISE